MISTMQVLINRERVAWVSDFLGQCGRIPPFTLDGSLGQCIIGFEVSSGLWRASS
jgi:hypothetical protein